MNKEEQIKILNSVLYRPWIEISDNEKETIETLFNDLQSQLDIANKKLDKIKELVNKYGYYLDIDVYNWLWTDEMLEPVQEKQTKFKIGDKVKLNPNVKKFNYGKGDVHYFEIGKIININEDTNVLDICFSGEKDWVGYSNEVISAKSSKKVAKSSKKVYVISTEWSNAK